MTRLVKVFSMLLLVFLLGCSDEQPRTATQKTCVSEDTSDSVYEDELGALDHDVCERMTSFVSFSSFECDLKSIGFFKMFLNANGVAVKNYYHNSNYGYSLHYPEDRLTQLGEPESGDGNRFVSFDGRTFMIIYGSDLPSNADKDILKAKFAKVSDDVFYKKRQDNWFVVSRHNGDSIDYEKYILLDGRILSFRLHYPLDDKVYWDTYLKNLDKYIKIND